LNWCFFLKKNFTNIIQNNHEFLELSFDEIKQILASGKSIFIPVLLIASIIGNMKTACCYKSLDNEYLEIKSH